MSNATRTLSKTLILMFIVLFSMPGCSGDDAPTGERSHERSDTGTKPSPDTGSSRDDATSRTDTSDHPDTTDRTDTKPEGSGLASESEVRRVLDEELPEWSEAILEVPSARDWSTNLEFETVFSAVGDRMVQYDNPDLPLPDAQRVGNEDKVLRLDREKGRLKYLSRERAWRPDFALEELPFDEQDTLGRIRQTLTALDVPLDGQAGGRTVDTELIRAGKQGEGATLSYETYHIVSIPRVVNQHRVLTSGIRAAVASSDDRPVIQRILVEWAPFRLTSELELRERSTVLDRAVEKVMARRPPTGSEETIGAELVYVPSAEAANTDQKEFVPAVKVAVMALPTPFIVTVPVAQ